MIGLSVQVIGCHGDDKPRGAKAALAAVEGDHRLLHRVQGTIGRADAFDGGDGFAMDLGQKQDATVNGAVPLCIADHDRARPAVTLVAAFFGASKALRIA